MKKSTKMLTILSLSFASITGLVLSEIPSNNFVFAEKETYSTEFITNLAKKLDSVPNENPNVVSFISSNGVEFTFETYRCSKDSNNIKISKGGYLRNITAINGLSRIKTFTCNDSSLASFVECEANVSEASFFPVNAFKGDSTCTTYAFNGTNFILKSNGELSVSALEVCYSCVAGTNGFITSDLASNMYAYEEECEFYDYGADGASESTPFRISGEEAFVTFAKDVCNGNSYTGKYFKLDEDLDFSKEGAPTYIAIGDSIENFFDGHFDASNGNKNHVIKLDSVFPAEGGVFGGISENAIVENLDVCGSIKYEDGSFDIGGVVGYADGGVIQNCNVSCDFNAHDQNDPYGVSCLGGILGNGENGVQIRSCCVNSEIIVYAGSQIGGLVGMCDESCLLENSVFDGELFVNPDNKEICEIGGLIGTYLGVYPSTMVRNCSINCSNIEDFSNRFDLWNDYDGMLLGRNHDDDEDELQSYIGAEVGCAYNSDFTDVLLDSGIWNTDGTWFAIYAFADGDIADWYIMEKDISTNYYIARLDAGSYDGIIFVRMSDKSTEPGWDYKWNQSEELKDHNFDENSNLYKITDLNKGYWTNFER